MQIAQNTVFMFVYFVYCILIAVCAMIRAQRNKNTTNRKEQTNMKAYKIFVDGLYIGTEDFTPAEVESIQRDEEITLVRA